MPAIYLAQWKWVAEDKAGDTFCWDAPRPDICVWRMDRRSNLQCAKEGSTPEGFGLFGYSERDDSIGEYLGDLEDATKITLSLRKREAIAQLMGWGEAPTTDTLPALILQMGLRYSDPTGLTAAKPFRGSPRRGFKLRVAGQVVVNERFDTSHPMWPATLAVWQADYRENRKYDSLGNLRKATGWAMRKYMVPADVLLPPEYIGDGWLKSGTIVTDNFNRGDEELGASADWDEVVGDGEVISNQVGLGATTGNSSFRNVNSLSGTDMYTQIDYVTGGNNSSFIGGSVRYAAAAQTYYDGRVNQADASRIIKTITGSRTTLANGTANPGPGTTIKLEIVDDDLELFQDAGSVLTVADDTSITTGTRGGLHFRAIDIGEAGDNFEAADVGVVATKPYYYRMYGKGQN